LRLVLLGAAALVAVASPAAPARAGIIKSHCSPTGDYCTAVAKRKGRIKLEIGTFAFRDYLVCVTGPRGTDCLQARTGGGNFHTDRLDVKRRFPRGPGRYKARWKVAGSFLGPALRFRIDETPSKRDRNLPKLYSGAAKFYTGKALKRRFGNSFTHGYAHRADCDQRKSRTRIKCEPVKWVIGDVSYRGWSVIWYKRRPANHLVYWHYAFRIVETNEYCLATGGSNCTEVHRVR